MLGQRKTVGPKLFIASFEYKKVSLVAPGIKATKSPSGENTQVKGVVTGHNHFIYHSFTETLLSAILLMACCVRNL